MNKIIYISWMPLTEYVIRENYIDYLVGNNIKFEYWDLTEMLRGKLDDYGEISAPYVRHFMSYDDIEEALANQKKTKTIFVYLMSLCVQTLKVYSLIGKYGCKTAYISWGKMPIEPITKLSVKVIAQKFLKPKRLIGIIHDRVKIYLYIKFSFIKKYSICFCAGEDLIASDNFSILNVPININDYEVFKEKSLENIPITIPGYAVFLDINLPYQSDLVLSRNSALNPGEYYKSLNSFFKIIENSFGVRVVIASHHKAKNTPKRFDGRECYHGKTAELVRDADFVISHHSTSISFAVLNKKRIIFIYTEEMKKKYLDSRVRWIKDIASFFNLDAYNIDNIEILDQLKIKKTSPENYYKYKYRYLTSSQTENKLSKQIFLEKLISFND